MPGQAQCLRGDAGLLDDPVDGHSVHPLAIEQLVGGVKKTLTR
jgi:hypothetical protein